jgi:hypothetical protein
MICWTDQPTPAWLTLLSHLPPPLQRLVSPLAVFERLYGSNRGLGAIVVHAFETAQAHTNLLPFFPRAHDHVHLIDAAQDGLLDWNGVWSPNSAADPRAGAE